MDKFSISMPAKINLGLDIVDLRKDGYHELCMVMQSIGVYDEVWLTKSKEPGIKLETDMPTLPTGKRNLAYRAAELFFDHFEIDGGVRIRIEKNIPVAAGLAGGSVDAAAVLKGLNRLYDVNASEKQIRDIGLLLGADVPFCIHRGTAIAEGIGEKITDLPPLPECSILLVKPTYSISTKDAFDAYDALEHPAHPNLPELIDAVRSGDLERIACAMGNSLEAAVLPEHADLRELIRRMREEGALGSGMSGSGPSTFGIFENKKQAEMAFQVLRREFPVCQFFVTSPYQPGAGEDKDF